MKKINKVLSMLVAAVMLIGMVSVVNVSAAVPADLTTEGVGLTVNADERYNGGTYGITSTAAHKGSRSLYINSLENKLGLGSSDDDFGLQKETAYGMKFSLKVDQNTSGKLQIKPQNNKNGKTRAVYYVEVAGTSATGFTLTNANQADRWQVTNDGDGWYTFESKCPVYVDNANDGDGGTPDFTDGEMFFFDGNFEAYIDDIEFYAWGNYNSDGSIVQSTYSALNFTNLVAKKDFEDPNAQPPTEPEVPGTGGDEDDPEDEPLTSIIPNKEDLITTGINLTPYQYNNASSFYGLTDVRSHNGDYSLYVDSTSGMLALGSGDDDFGLLKETAYGFKFSIYVEENQSGKIQIKPQESYNNKTKAVYYTEITGTSATGLTLAGNCATRWQVTNEGNGWVTLESKCPVYVDNANDGDGKGTPDFTDGLMFTFEGKFKAFIDDVEFYAWGNYNNGAIVQDTYSELNFTTLVGKRDFEPVGNYISAFKKSVSGNDVTVSVDIRNCTDDNYTAQLFLAVYNGDVLESIVMTDKTSVPKVSETAAPTPLSKTVTVPADRTMTMFLWNSLEGMSPIRRCESYSAVQ